MSESRPDSLTEADTCRLFVTPKLVAAGWDGTPHEIAEQRSFTAGRIVLAGRSAKRREGKRADYILRYTRDFAIAVVEAKPESKTAGDGMQQAKDYAEILGLKFAYATNGHDILEFDFLTADLELAFHQLDAVGGVFQGHVDETGFGRGSEATLA